MADAAPAGEEQPAAPEGGFRGGFGERGRGWYIFVQPT